MRYFVSQCGLQTKRQNQLAPYSLHCGGIERTDVFDESGLRHRLQVVELYLGVAAQVGRLCNRDLGG